MAECLMCEREMTDKRPCTVTAYHRDGRPFERIPFSAPNDLLSGGLNHCHDCSTPAGAFHHPGCDAERCPDCGGQSIGCDCWWDEDGADHHPNHHATVAYLIEQLQKCDPGSLVTVFQGSEWGDVPIQRVDGELNGTVWLLGKENS